jgi:hypothetical protein
MVASSTGAWRPSMSRPQRTTTEGAESAARAAPGESTARLQATSAALVHGDDVMAPPIEWERSSM